MTIHPYTVLILLILYIAVCDIFCMVSGSKDYSVVFDVNIWLHAMFTESESPSPFYSEEFKEWADYVIHHELNMTQEDITQTSCRNVYLHLISH